MKTKLLLIAGFFFAAGSIFAQVGGVTGTNAALIGTSITLTPEPSPVTMITVDGYGIFLNATSQQADPYQLYIKSLENQIIQIRFADHVEYRAASQVDESAQIIGLAWYQAECYCYWLENSFLPDSSFVNNLKSNASLEPEDGLDHQYEIVKNSQGHFVPIMISVISNKLHPFIRYN